MKKTFVKLTSILLALIMIVGTVTVTGLAEGVSKEELEADRKNGEIVDAVSTYVLNPIFDIALFVKGLFGNGFESIDEYENSNFNSGSETFLEEAPEGAKFYLGSASASLVPDDYTEKKYDTGGYFDSVLISFFGDLIDAMSGKDVSEFSSHDGWMTYFKAILNSFRNVFVCVVKEVLDDMRVRTIAMSDNTGSGISVMAVSDSIGVSSKDIGEIRALVLEKIKEIDPSIKFKSIDIFSTHTHSGIDTQGLWTNTIPGVLSKIFFGKDSVGTDDEYMEFYRETVANAIVEACLNIEAGTMTYASKDIGDSYFNNKNRKTASAILSDMSRFMFTPDNTDSVPTMIASAAAHPDVAGLPTEDGKGDGSGISGDYIYYMGQAVDEYYKTVNGKGCNFMFVNGAILGIYETGVTNAQTETHRVDKAKWYGLELGKIAAALTMTEEEIRQSEYLSEVVGEFKPNEETGETPKIWYEDWEKVEEITLSPVINAVYKTVYVKVTNPVIKLVGGLAELANYNILKGEDGYYIPTEIGYMEIGCGENKAKIAMVPGELCQDLVCGGTSLYAETSTNGVDFGYPTIEEIFGEDVVAFGLANDAIGYIVPDSDYALGGDGERHYQELISLGKNTASTLFEGYLEIAQEIAAK